MAERAPGPDELRTRIEAVYMALEREAGPRGALSWFARMAHTSPVTVSRWLTHGKEYRPPLGPALGLLEALERLADVERALKG